MRITLTCATLVAALNLAAPLPALAQAHYHLAPQKGAEKYGAYYPVAITDYGLAAGTLVNNAAGTNYAYYSEGKFVSEIDFCSTIGAANSTVLNGISRDAALSYTVGVCNGTHFGYVYNNAANTSTTVQYPGAISTFPYGVNANGVIVGEWDGPVAHGFSLVGGTYTSIEAPGAYYTVALGVTDQGAIFGNYYVTSSANYGFVLAATGAFTTINYPGSAYTGLTGLNSQNMAVGLYEDASGPQHAFAWQNGTYMEAPLRGATSSRATAVNDNGDVAGWYVDASNTQFGFVWQPATNQVIKVNAPKNSRGITVTGINNTHAQITGSYVDPSTRETIGFIGTCTGADCF
jgi:hypothetical protein